MSDDAIRESGLLTPRKIAIQLLGFAVGIVLLIWCIKGAIEGGDWGRIRHADPGLVAVLLSCTGLSLLVNGSVFWITVQPIKRVGFSDMQRLNLAANLLNYAPIRVGALARVLYHLRVDGLGLLQVGAWFAFIGYVLVLGVASCLLATLIHDRIDWIWMLIVIVLMVLGGLICRTVFAMPLIARYSQGIDRIAGDPRSLWGACGLRLVDLAAYTGRMAAALAILGIDLPWTHVIVLAIVALGASLTPFGRVGIREWSVAKAAMLLSLTATDVEGKLEQLALLESAGEALVIIPLGGLALFWYRSRWSRARAASAESAQVSPDD